jgi:hypothetical protein
MLVSQSFLSTIFRKFKEWVRSLIYKDTIIISDSTYQKYIKVNEQKDGVKYSIPYKRDVDGETYTIIDFAVIKFPVGTRNIIFDLKRLNLHRVRFIPKDYNLEYRTKSGVSWDWINYNGYKLNIYSINNFTNYRSANFGTSFNRHVNILFDPLKTDNPDGEALGGLYFSTGRYNYDKEDTVTSDIKFYKNSEGNYISLRNRLSAWELGSRGVDNTWDSLDDRLNDSDSYSLTEGERGCKMVSGVWTSLFLANGNWYYLIH